MVMEPKGVNGFMAIIQFNNFAKAAKKWGITPSALSIHVSTLEHLIDSKLLLRKSPFVLTETGNIFYSHALRLRERENGRREKIGKIVR